MDLIKLEIDDYFIFIHVRKNLVGIFYPGWGGKANLHEVMSVGHNGRDGKFTLVNIENTWIIYDVIKALSNNWDIAKNRFYSRAGFEKFQIDALQIKLSTILNG